MTGSTANSTKSLTKLQNRGVIRLTGPDRVGFLQGLVSNNVESVTRDKAIYACMLTPQGKFLHDFFLIQDGESLLIECEGDRRDDLLRRLAMYRLRAKIDLDAGESLASSAGAEKPESWNGLADPRHPSLGYRFLSPFDVQSDAEPGDFNAYDRRRIALGVPDGSRDMVIGKSILLENNIDLLHGVAWDKGCYTGQELTARTHYRGLIKKRLAPVRIVGAAPPLGTPIVENDVEIGEMRDSRGDLGLALLKLDILRRPRPIVLADATLTPELPDYLAEHLEQVAT
jgi:folate-binding protein YgfZ